MITLCSVVPDSKQYNDYANVMIDSLLRRTKLISNVLLAVPLTEVDDIKTIKKWTEREIEFHKFHCPSQNIWYGHAEGLHSCIDQVTTEYLMFCDPDLFFCSAVDELYLELLIKHNLNYIGCSHHSAVSNAYSFFPYVVNSLVKTSHLPPKTWLKGLLKYRPPGNCLRLNLENPDWDEPSYADAAGKYLLPSPIPGHWQKLPNLKPGILFDTSVNLCMWGIEHQWQWLSFQTIDTHNYSTKYCRGTVKVGKLPPQKLIHHCVRSLPEQLKEEYEKSLADHEENL